MQHVPTKESSNLIKLISDREIEELKAISHKPNQILNIDNEIYQLPSANLELCAPVKMSLLTKEHITYISNKYPKAIIIFSILANSELCKIIGMDQVSTLSLNSCKLYIYIYISPNL